jgi:hypothetical protein
MTNFTRFGIALGAGPITGVLMSTLMFVPEWNQWMDKTMSSVLHLPAIGLLTAWDKLGLPPIGPHGRWNDMMQQTLFVILLQWGGAGASVGWIWCWWHKRRTTRP